MWTGHVNIDVVTSLHGSETDRFCLDMLGEGGLLKLLGLLVKEAKYADRFRKRRWQVIPPCGLVGIRVTDLWYVANVSGLNACKTLVLPLVASAHLNHHSGELTRTLYKHFTSVSPGWSGRCAPSRRAPMLGGQPLTDMVSSKQTRTARLWTRLFTQ